MYSGYDSSFKYVKGENAIPKLDNTYGGCWGGIYIAHSPVEIYSYDKIFMCVPLSLNKSIDNTSSISLKDGVKVLDALYQDEDCENNINKVLDWLEAYEYINSTDERKIVESYFCQKVNVHTIYW